MEKVLCAALWLGNTVDEELVFQPVNSEGEKGIVIAGWRHGSCLEVKHALGISKSVMATQGFLTSYNRFLNRDEARRLVLVTGQLSKTEFDDELYSEDLY